MDTCVELLVKKKWELIDVLKVIGIFLCLPLACLMVYILLSMIPGLSSLVLFAFCGLAYLTCRIILDMSREYEYIFINGDMSVDIIYAQRKRKRIIEIEARKIEKMVPYNSDEYKNRMFDNKYFAGKTHKESDLWCIEFHDEAKGKCLLIFSPTKEYLLKMKPFMKPLVMRETLSHLKGEKN